MALAMRATPDRCKLGCPFLFCRSCWVVLTACGLASLQNNGGGPSILLASGQHSTCLLLFDLAIRCVPGLLPEIFSVWLMKLLDIWIGWNPVVRTHIRLRGFMTVRREAPLVLETMGHLGISISMVYTAVENGMVAEIGGSVRRRQPWRRWSQPGV